MERVSKHLSFKDILRFILRVLMVVVLLVVGTFVLTVRMLKPENLTPIALDIVNDFLDAKVEASRIALDLSYAPMTLRVDVDSLAIISGAYTNLPENERLLLPTYADSLISLTHFSGEINLYEFLTANRVALRDVILDGLSANIVSGPSGKMNYEVFPTDTLSSETKSFSIPSISVHKFVSTDTRQLRYYDCTDSTSTIVVTLSATGLDGSGQPLYRLNINGRLFGKDYFDAAGLSFGLDGRFKWDPSMPGALSVEECTVGAGCVRMKVDTEVEFSQELIVKSGRLELLPVPVMDIIALLPENIRREYKLNAQHFNTESTISATAELTGASWSPSSNTVPDASLSLTMSDSPMRYGKARFRNVAVEGRVELRSISVDSTLIYIDRLEVAGPATRLSVSGSVSHPVSDPDFSIDVKGTCDLSNLPPVLSAYAKGYLSGLLKADVKARGTKSMFGTNEFHRLNLRGSIKSNDFYYLSNDTNKMVSIGTVDIAFNSRINNQASSLVPLFGASVKVDTAALLIDGVSVRTGNLDLRAGIENSNFQADTTLVVPLGGVLSVANLEIASITDTAGVIFKDLEGRLSMSRYRDHLRLPLISAHMHSARVSAGTPGTRLILRDASIDASTFKLRDNTDTRRAIKAVADSITREYPDLPPDSVYKLVLEKRLRNRRPGHHRVHLEEDSDEEVVNWGLSRGFRRFLLGWQLNGKLTTRHARFFTPSFPLRNRISRLEVDFSNDSIVLNSVKCRSGRSDLAMTGLVSNIKRSLTSASSSRPLRLKFNISSDTLDVNEFSNALFTGHRDDTGFDGIDDENVLDTRMEKIAKERKDSIRTILIPSNINASIALKADNIFYSDLSMKGLHGDIELQGGAVNLKSLEARSEAGNIGLSALYYAPQKGNIRFGFGLDVTDFDIARFLKLVPAVDSVMPMIRDFSGIIDAEVAATAHIDPQMNIELPTLDAAVQLSGDSLAFINPDTYMTIGKWLRFKDRMDNRIKHVKVEMIVKDNVLQVFPFEFDIDRYRLGVAGTNDLNMNFDYHIAVLRSPLPFKFGINIKGNPKHYKVRFGGPKFKEGQIASSTAIVDTARISLLRQIEGVFKRGVTTSGINQLKVSGSYNNRRPYDNDVPRSDELGNMLQQAVEGPRDIQPVNSQTKDKKKKK